MESVSLSIKIIFVIITLLTVYLFYAARKKSKPFLIIIFCWMLLQSILAISGFYFQEYSNPPAFMLLILPPVVCIIVLFITKPGRNFIDNLNIKYLTALHTVRIFVELILYALFIAKTIPVIMTFEGRNFDILAGITAPIIYYFGYKKKVLSRGILIAWNVLSLILLFNIVITALLSLKTPFQQFGFDQPNIALTYFPFNLLAAVVVPLVLFAHLAALKQLVFNSKLHSINHSNNNISL